MDAANDSSSGPSAAPPRPPRPALAEMQPPPPLGLRRRLLNAGKRAWLGLVDRGVLGLRPLERHVVICGFPRSGSTLLQLMATTTVHGLKTFDDEATALDKARLAPRNHPMLLTKRPNDVFWIDEVREFYADRRAEPRFIVTVRDPRDILTSVHSSDPDGYYVTSERWGSIYSAFQYTASFPDVLSLRFEDIIHDPDGVEARLQDFIGWQQTGDFSDFHREDVGDFNTLALSGLRPLDAGGIGRWRGPEHVAHIEALLREIPDLPRYLVDLGYESDDAWASRYRP